MTLNIHQRWFTDSPASSPKSSHRRNWCGGPAFMRLSASNPEILTSVGRDSARPEGVTVVANQLGI
jgi:hypothetical protein